MSQNDMLESIPACSILDNFAMCTLVTSWLWLPASREEVAKLLLVRLVLKYTNCSVCLWLAVIVLSQSYRMQNGPARLLRENLSLFTLFKNKQEKQMEVIKEELGSVIDVELFIKAYDIHLASSPSSIM